MDSIHVAGWPLKILNKLKLRTSIMITWLVALYFVEAARGH